MAKKNKPAKPASALSGGGIEAYIRAVQEKAATEGAPAPVGAVAAQKARPELDLGAVKARVAELQAEGRTDAQVVNKLRAEFHGQSREFWKDLVKNTPRTAAASGLSDAIMGSTPVKPSGADMPAVPLAGQPITLKAIQERERVLRGGGRVERMKALGAARSAGPDPLTEGAFNTGTAQRTALNPKPVEKPTRTPSLAEEWTAAPKGTMGKGKYFGKKLLKTGGTALGISMIPYVLELLLGGLKRAPKSNPYMEGGQLLQQVQNQKNLAQLQSQVAVKDPDLYQVLMNMAAGRPPARQTTDNEISFGAPAPATEADVDPAAMQFLLSKLGGQ